MPHDLASALAPTGRLRAAINLSNFLLVSGRSADGDPQGVSPDMARAVAERLGVAVHYLPYATPSRSPMRRPTRPGTSH